MASFLTLLLSFWHLFLPHLPWLFSFHSRAAFMLFHRLPVQTASPKRDRVLRVCQSSCRTNRTCQQCDPRIWPSLTPCFLEGRLIVSCVLLRWQFQPGLGEFQHTKDGCLCFLQCLEYVSSRLRAFLRSQPYVQGSTSCFVCPDHPGVWLLVFPMILYLLPARPAHVSALVCIHHCMHRCLAEPPYNVRCLPLMFG